MPEGSRSKIDKSRKEPRTKSMYLERNKSNVPCRLRHRVLARGLHPRESSLPTICLQPLAKRTPRYHLKVASHAFSYRTRAMPCGHVWVRSNNPQNRKLCIILMSRNPSHHLRCKFEKREHAVYNTASKFSASVARISRDDEFESSPAVRFEK